MPNFNDVISASPEGLVNIFYRISVDEHAPAKKQLKEVASKLGLRSAQLVCGVGFNAAINELTDIIHVLGFKTYDDLARERNRLFTNDVYYSLSINNVLAIYQAVLGNDELLQIMQYLLASRLKRIEAEIEEKVNSMVIERYKKEIKAIYVDGIAQPEFAETRLENTDSGFRALVNEVSTIVESRLIPVGDIFFRDSILPEEKRRIIAKGLIPNELIRDRLDDQNISEKERTILERYVKE